MGTSHPTDITRALAELRQGGGKRQQAASLLLNAVYDDLRAVAAGLLRGERSEHTLEATALVHEAYLRLVEQDRVDWTGRAHFRAIAAQAMRRILVDHARRRGSAKRGGPMARVTLQEAEALGGGAGGDVLDVERALERLSRQSERAARVVEMKFYGGMTGEEISSVLGVSPRTVKADWAVAKAWLARELACGDR